MFRRFFHWLAVLSGFWWDGSLTPHLRMLKVSQEHLEPDCWSDDLRSRVSKP